MAKRVFSLWAGAAITVLAAQPLAAEGMSLGEFEYRNSCVQCHGEDGTGGGPVADFLKSVPPDLTGLQKNNGGVFPVTNLFSVIEGSADIGAHGRDMPLWGNRYRERASADEEGSFSPEEVEEYAQTRVLALIEYLATIQKN